MTVNITPHEARTRPCERHKSAKKAAVVLISFMAATAMVSFSNTASASSMSSTGLFQTAEKRSSKLQAFSKWNNVLRRYYRERRQTRNVASIRRWRAFIRQTRDLPRAAQLRAVNRFVNRFAYRTDSRNYGRVDYWATPRQFFAKGGDCEDFVIVKYLTLKALGWKQRQLRLVVLIDRRKRQAHAVLAVYHAGRRHILDNQFRSVMRDTQIRHYRPVYSINERNWWFHMNYQTAAR